MAIILTAWLIATAGYIFFAWKRRKVLIAVINVGIFWLTIIPALISLVYAILDDQEALSNNYAHLFIVGICAGFPLLIGVACVAIIRRECQSNVATPRDEQQKMLP